MAMANNVYTYYFKLAKKQKKREKKKREKSSTAPDINHLPKYTTQLAQEAQNNNCMLQQHKTLWRNLQKGKKVLKSWCTSPAKVLYTNWHKTRSTKQTMLYNNSKRRCVIRESNPGLKLGRLTS